MTNAKKFVTESNARIDNLIEQGSELEKRTGEKLNVSLLDQAEPWMWIQEVDHTRIEDTGENAIWELEGGSRIEWINVERRYLVVEV